jgi:DNA-binding transcriptional LysR family regulator
MMESKKEGKRGLGALNMQVLRTFVTVAETGSFSNAAKALEIAQPTVSFQIASMEDMLGATLLHRRPRPELTPVGRDVYTRARIILSRVAELEASLDQFSQLESGQIRIGLSAPRYGLSLIAAFMRERPGLDVVTVSGNSQDLLALLEENRIDIAILGLPEATKGFTCRLAENIYVCAWLPAGDPLAGRSAIDMETVASLPLVMREAGSVTRLVFEQACAQNGLTPNVRLNVHSRESVREAVAAGIGAGIVFNTEANYDARVNFVPIEPRITAGTYLVYPEALFDLPAVKALVELSERKTVAPAAIRGE